MYIYPLFFGFSFHLGDQRALTEVPCIWRDMDGPRDCHIKWSKSEREKQIYINAYMWDLEKYFNM